MSIPPSVVSTHITEVLKRHAHELLGRQETKQLIDHLKETYPILVEEVTPNPLSIGDVQKVLAKLLRENVSIRNLPLYLRPWPITGKLLPTPKYWRNMCGKLWPGKLQANMSLKGKR